MWENAEDSQSLWNQGDNACPSGVIGQECNETNDGECDGFLGRHPVERVIWAVAGLGYKSNAPVGGLLEIRAVIVVVGADDVAFNGSLLFVDPDRVGVLLESFFLRVWSDDRHDTDVWRTRVGGKGMIGRRLGGCIRQVGHAE